LFCSKQALERQVVVLVTMLPETTAIMEVIIIIIINITKGA
jgi:hypothetical protein